MSAKASGKEKRKHPRYPVGLTLDIHAGGETIGKFRGSIADLSVGGMAFKTDAMLDPGMSLYLKINIPLEIRGEIRHMKGSVAGGLHRYGVRFHKIGFSTPDGSKPENFVAAKFQKEK